MKKQTDLILPKFWLLHKPYSAISAADAQYIRCANGVLSIFDLHKDIQLLKLFTDREDIKHLACFLVGYMEDKASEIGLFDAFVRLHQEQYGKPLPFYEPGDEYDPELLNEEDLRFLIWYFTNCWKTDVFVGPTSYDFEFLGALIFEFLEDHWDLAIVNTALQDAYKINEKNPDYYGCRLAMQKLALSGFLFYPDINKKWNDQLKEITEEVDMSNTDVIAQLISDMNDTMTNTHKSRLLCLTCWQWAKEFYKGRYPEEWFDFQGKASGLFRILDQNKDHIRLEHQPTSAVILAETWTMPDFRDVEKGDFIYLGLALYQNQWHFSGMMIESPDTKYRQTLLERTHEHLDFQLLVPDLRESMEETISKQKANFNQFQPEGPLTFQSGSELPAYNQRFFEFSISLEQSEKRSPEGIPTPKNMTEVNPKEANTNYMLFFNSRQGMELHPGPHYGIPHPRSQDFDPEQDQEKAMRLFLLDESTSVELCHYVLDTYRSHFKFLNSTTFRPYVEDLDFILRFKKTVKYEPKPQVLIRDFSGKKGG